MDETTSESDLVDAYLKHFATRDDALFWAVTAVNELVGKDPERAWNLTLRLIDKAPNPESLSYVAAGPLEDLLNDHGGAVIDRVELHARRDPKFRLALSDVWGTSNAPGDIFDRVLRAVGPGSNFRWGARIK